MDSNKAVKFDLVEIKKAVLRKFPLVADSFSNTKFIETKIISTACTDGKNIYYNPNFMDEMTYEEQIFTIAHEGLHIAFEHIDRQEIKLKQTPNAKPQTIKKQKELWNVATDAVINQALKAEGLPIKQGLVDMPEAHNQMADTIYNKLLEEYNKQKDKEQQSKQSDGNQSQESDSDSSGQDKSIEDFAKQFGETCDDHGAWENSNEKDFEEENSSPESQNGNQDQEDPETQEDNEAQDNGKNLENNFTQKNAEKKKEITQSVMKKIEEQKDKAKTYGNTAGNQSTIFGDVGNAKKSIYNWKKILSREFNDYIRCWSNRRATAENGYQSRIVSTYMYNKPRTEVLLDTSGSVNIDLIKGFLRQIKPMLQDSQLFVGCFDTKFYGFTEIRTKKDIDNFVIKGRGGTNLDTAVRSFTKDDRINKVIFTDGEGSMPKQDLEKTKRLYWVLTQLSNFSPCCGKVLYADAKEIKESTTQLLDSNTDEILEK